MQAYLILNLYNRFYKRKGLIQYKLILKIMKKGFNDFNRDLIYAFNSDKFTDQNGI